jgi:hypothetical protein
MTIVRTSISETGAGRISGWKRRRADKADVFPWHLGRI